jgi:uncharacterized protein YcfJ
MQQQKKKYSLSKEKTMRQILTSIMAFVILTSSAFAGSTTTYGNVVQIDPIYTNVRQQQPNKVCRNVDVPVYGTVQGNGASGGDVLGGMIIGGLLGKGATGKDDGAAIGAIIGGMVAAENSNNSKQVITGYRSERQCTTEYEYVNTQVVNEYDIVYNVNGNRIVIRSNRAQGERAFVGQRKRFRISYQLLN